MTPSSSEFADVSWEYGIVAFLDLLGFSNMVEGDAKQLQPIHLNRLLASFSELTASHSVNNIDIRAFSDSIILSTPLTNKSVYELMLATIDLQKSFIKQGILARGAIALGKHYSNEKLIYSEALVKAYKMERDKSKFPRVVVDNNLLDWFWHDSRSEQPDILKTKSLLLKDRDNINFLNYLDKSLLQKHLELLQSYQIDKVDAGVLEKLQWLAQYHNHAVTVESAPEMIFNGTLLQTFRSI